MRFFSLATAGFVLMLAACVDADIETTVLDADRVRMHGDVQVDRAMFDMVGGTRDFCPEAEGGVFRLTGTHAGCTITRTGTFAEMFEAAGPGTPTPTVTDHGDGTVRVAIPLAAIAAETQAMGADPAMFAMFRPMMEGRAIVLRISGGQIVSSNGTISPDGSSAVLRIPLTALLEGPRALPATFEATVRY